MSSAGIWRPVQFLGSKLRVIGEVQQASVRGLNEHERVWDAFSGSSVVSQSFAATGRPVFATDALAASVVFARTQLGVDRINDASPATLIPLILQRADSLALEGVWAESLEGERRALQASDAESLAAMGATLPQRWRLGGASAVQRQLFADVEQAAALGEKMGHGLTSATYAGTYFGVVQAVRLDAIRSAISDLALARNIDVWETSAMLTALSFAASRAVHSAGKHFAQPMKLSPTDFHRGRLLSDRSVNVDAEFAAALVEIGGTAASVGGHHLAERTVAEMVDADRLRAMNVRSVYADPPYTAQQYSRFYHLLDVLIEGVPAHLQIRGDQATKGLYPVERYRSPFCSRAKAPGAFVSLSRHARDAGARLVVSYSVSSGSSTGNARSIDLDALLEVLRATYGHQQVSVQELDIRYRQFNSAGRSSSTRHDPEVLIVAEVA